jgi:hypothetical protein
MAEGRRKPIDNLIDAHVWMRRQERKHGVPGGDAAKGEGERGRLVPGRLRRPEEGGTVGKLDNGMLSTVPALVTREAVGLQPRGPTLPPLVAG